MATDKGKKRILSAFGRRFKNGNGSTPAWLAKLRRSAIEKFDELGFPTTRQEEWKYTNIEPIAALEFQEARQYDMTISTRGLLSLSFADGARNRLVFVDGSYCAEYSATANLPAGVRMQSLAEALTREDVTVEPWLNRYARFDDNPFVALNTAFMEDGAAIFLPKNCRLEEPIYAIFVSSGGADPIVSHPRNLFVCGEGSRVKIVESYLGLGKGGYFANPVTEIAAAPDSLIDHYRLQSEGEGALHVGALYARLEHNANLTSHNVTLGGALVRNDVNVVLDGEGAECMLNGLYLTAARQHVDNHTEIEHTQPRAVSRELYKGILSGQAHVVFNGKILVHQAAQKSDARQTNKNLLLSKDAVVNSKPQLEIYADDVKCSHGSTIGQLDRDALFYLRSRGISADDARSLLSYAFAAEILNKVKIAPLRARLDEFLLDKLNRTAVVQ
jgi:Fe-S cluster assembly protein SufD